MHGVGLSCLQINRSQKLAGANLHGVLTRVLRQSFTFPCPSPYLTASPPHGPHLDALPHLNGRIRSTMISYADHSSRCSRFDALPHSPPHADHRTRP